jgi:hypothetical protein
VDYWGNRSCRRWIDAVRPLIEECGANLGQNPLAADVNSFETSNIKSKAAALQLILSNRQHGNFGQHTGGSPILLTRLHGPRNIYLRKFTDGSVGECNILPAVFDDSKFACVDGSLEGLTSTDALHMSGRPRMVRAGPVRGGIAFLASE